MRLARRAAAKAASSGPLRRDGDPDEIGGSTLSIVIA